MSKITKLYRKLHRWPGLIVSFLLLYYSITGIFMNHRELFSGFDVSRQGLPKEFQYQNWNNSALKGNLIINADSILVYGNIGVWVTDSTFLHYSDLNHGFPDGSDNRKVFDLHRTANGQLYAATQFGLYAFDNQRKAWKDLQLNANIKRFVGVESIDDSLFVLNRSYLYKAKSEGSGSRFVRTELKVPEGYKKEVSLFETMWQIHSGEIFGIPGKLFVDLMGLITLFLSITGIIYFFFPKWIKRRKRKGTSTGTLLRWNRWSLKWHNKTGEWLFAFLIILFLTGIFLRPPLLIAIAKAKVKPIKFSHLDQPNPWYDKLRDIHFDTARNTFLISTSEGMYSMDRYSLQPKWMEIQPPVSVMGINTFEPYRNGAFLIGSFTGLFLWHPAHPEIYNYAKGELFQGASSGRPVGDFKVTGMIIDVSGRQYMVDYDRGVLPLWHNRPFPEMPENVLKASKMSLWNLSLEIHTGRFFRPLLGSFYILLVPLSGLTAVIVVISGYLLWRKKFRKRKKRN